MEKKIINYYDTVTMPPECAGRIEASLTRPARAASPRWLKTEAAVAVILVLMLAMFNAETIAVHAQNFYDLVVNAISHEAGPIGEVEDGIFVSFSGGIAVLDDEKSDYAVEKYLSNESFHLAEVRDGRLYFVANGENIDITDLCSMETAFIYAVEDNDGRIHYLCVGGTPEYWGSEEYIWDPSIEEDYLAWNGGGGYNTWDYNTEDSRWPWVYDARERVGYPFNF